MARPSPSSCSGADWERVRKPLFFSDLLDAPWLDLPALTQGRVGNIEQLRWWKTANAGKPYGVQIKPFNFFLVGHAPKPWRPVHLSDAAPIAPFERDPTKWLSLAWMDRRTGRALKVGTGPNLPPDTRLKTYRDEIEEDIHHPEPNSLGLDGEVCHRQTKGLLARRPVQIASPELIGKGANRLEEVEAGLVHRFEDVQTSYGSALGPLSDAEREALKGIPLRELAQELEVSERYVRMIRNAHLEPSTQVLQRIRWVLADCALGG